MIRESTPLLSPILSHKESWSVGSPPHRFKLVCFSTSPQPLPTRVVASFCEQNHAQTLTAAATPAFGFQIG